MTPWIMLHFDVHENYTKYLKDAMAKAMGARGTHLLRSKELSEIGHTWFLCGKILWSAYSRKLRGAV